MEAAVLEKRPHNLNFSLLARVSAEGLFAGLLLILGMPFIVLI
jgi:hypothetical protein